MRIKLDKADRVFSRFIRERDDWKCARCHRQHERSSQGLHASHYFGRGRENTRFDEENVDSLCFGCHRVWGSDDHEAYRVFKITQLGLNGFNKLTMRANTTTKKDRKMAYLYWKGRLEHLMTKKRLPMPKI